MCDLFQANPWKPLLCTNCHQNRSGHDKISDQEQPNEPSIGGLPSSSSSMHLYEEIMAQYFTITPTDLESLQSASFNEDRLPTPSNDPDVEEDSFTDEEQEMPKPATIEFVQNQSMINTQGIILMGPELPPAKPETKKTRKIHLLKKSKSNADECMKKSDIIDGSSSKHWWFKTKKSPTVSTEPNHETNKTNAASPTLNQQPRIRVLPEINKLTLNEALNIARRQHLSLNHEPRLPPQSKTSRVTSQSHYSSSIASTTSSSTQSSSEYETNPTAETTYLVATGPIEIQPLSESSLDRSLRITCERLTADLGLIIDEYKRNLAVAHFQPLKSLLHQLQTSKILSQEGIYCLLLQILNECLLHSNSSINTITIDHYLVALHSSLPIVVATSAPVSMTQEDQSVEPFLHELVQQLFDPSSAPIYSDISTLETICCRFLANSVFQFSSGYFDQSISAQRAKLLDLFWNQIQSLRHMQITDDNQQSLFVLYHLMRRLNQSNN